MSKLCYGCMKMKTQSPICEHCGYNENVPNYPHQLPIGTVLRDQYVVGKVLGQGGFGITYIGWDQSLENPVAIKEYYPSSFVTRDASKSLSVTGVGGNAMDQFFQNRDQFLKEARVLAKLTDVPGIIRVHNLFKENDTAYIIMEYAEGIDLKRYMRMRERTLTVPEVLAVMRPVMEALKVVHDGGMIHQDISPDNIMIQSNGKAKLLDFGAVREVFSTDGGQSQTGESVMKQGFAPMEQYSRKGGMGPWTDIYALCATMFYCLTGRVPNSAPERIIGNENVDWKQVEGLTETQIAVLEKGMAIVPEQRISSIQELYNGLFGDLTAMTGFRATEFSVVQPAAPAEPAKEPAPVKEPAAPAPAPAAPVKEAPAQSAPAASYPSHTISLEETPAEKPAPQPEAPPAPTPKPEQKPETGKAPAEQKTEGKKGPAINKKTGIILAAAALVLLVCFFTIHIWKDPTCTDGYKCMFCGKTKGEPLGHTWMDATCDAPKTCSTCGDEEGEALQHIWADATCLNPMACELCGKQEGTTIDHNWQEATYTSPKTCTICSETEGHVKGYVGDIAGSYNGTYARTNEKTGLYQLRKKLENCRSFTLNYTITKVNRGKIFGNFEVFIHAGDNYWDWVSLGMIEVKEINDTVSVTFQLEKGVSFDAIAVFCQAAGSNSYSASIEITDAQLYE